VAEFLGAANHADVRQELEAGACVRVLVRRTGRDGRRRPLRRRRRDTRHARLDRRRRRPRLRLGERGPKREAGKRGKRNDSSHLIISLAAASRGVADIVPIAFAPRQIESIAGRRVAIAAAPDATIAPPMDYATLKLIHESAVALSFAGFFARGLGMQRNAGWIRHRSAKMLPHVVDTVLIASAIALAWTLRLSPANAPWIAAKIAGLVVYIALGLVALRFGRTKAVRATAWALALLTFLWIVSVAITKDPRGILALVS
jgi:uncharacterized membrane protein SirB2